jgi:hypothetical protein
VPQANQAVSLTDVNDISTIATYSFCEDCQKQTCFLPIYTARQVARVSRSTVYYWMCHDWIHWKELPSGRRMICRESLDLRARLAAVDLKIPKKQSRSVRHHPSSF